jgi:2-C-methyl-D-erythritol 4-phosphate cytidylyltransferase
MTDSLNTNYSLLNTPKTYAIIVAGGSGSRMQSAIPKQFLLLNGKPLMMYTIEAFYNSQANPSIIVVLHPHQQQYWKDLCREHDFRIPHHLANGGDTRFQSVKNGLDLIESEAIIAVHDAVRPLTPIEVIDESYRYAAEHGNAIVAVQSRDSIRQLKNNRSAALLRDEIYLVQTPQTFRSDILKNAYAQEYQHAFTDDASVVELSGVDIHMIEGAYTNIKITFPEDIAIAEMILGNKE